MYNSIVPQEQEDLSWTTHLLDIAQYMHHNHNTDLRQQQRMVVACLLQWTLSYFTFHDFQIILRENLVQEKETLDFTCYRKDSYSYPLISNAVDLVFDEASTKVIRKINQQRTIVLYHV